MSTWTIGDSTIIRIEESERFGSMPMERFFAGFDREVFRRHLHWMVPGFYAPEADRILVSSHSWLIRTPHHTILLDTCAGNHKHRPFNSAFHQLDTPYLDRLRAAGVAPEEVDIVLCSHLHADHTGWNTRLDNGRWVPTFPKAKYLFSRVEDQYWQAQLANPEHEASGRNGAYRDSVLPVKETGQCVLVDDAHAIEDALTIEPAPGHTPGHVVLKIAGAGRRGLFSGDVLHHPIQVHEPHWNTNFCIDQDQARATRRSVLEFCAEHDAILFPQHFARPYASRIRRAGEGFVPDFDGALR